ncbi:MAG: DMT family transporter [Hellea sp.]|nr:DMT family transporter [Hellea sp.]
MRPTLREYVAGTGQSSLPMSGPNWGYVFGALGAVLFSMKAIFVKVAYQPGSGISENEIDAITLMAMRLGFSMPIYLLIMALVLRRIWHSDKENPKLSDMVLAGALGILGYYICAFLDIEALKYVTAQLERLILFTYPVFVLILSAVFLGFRPKFLSVVFILIGYSGIIVIFAGGDITESDNLWLGVGMLLACAILFAAFQLLAKPMIARLGSTLFTCCAMIAAGMVIFTHLTVQNLESGVFQTASNLPLRIWMIGIALAFLSTLIPSFLVNIAIGRIGAQATATLGLLSPVATIIFAILWLGEPFGKYDAFGTLLTLIGIGLYSWHSRKSDPTPPKYPAALHK